MKKYTALFITVAIILTLSACGSQPADDRTAPTVDNPLPETAAPEPQSADAPVDVTAADPYVPDHHDEHDDHNNHEDEHSHHPCEGNNVVEHDNVGYCGNTITSISCHGHEPNSEPWERSFWGSESVELTDLLLYLDYSGDICRCPAEYTVDTEFGTGYGINLTNCYARYDGGQCDLTAEQVEQIQKIIDWAIEQPEGGLSVNLQSLQPKE